MSDDAPPLNTTMNTEHRNITTSYPQYPHVPIGREAEDDEDNEDFTYKDDEDFTYKDANSSSFYKSGIYMLIIAMAIAHIWTVYTLRTDMNIVLAHQEEKSQQYKHIIQLLQKHTVAQWQIVPA
jgi:hypothetical protein